MPAMRDRPDHGHDVVLAAGVPRGRDSLAAQPAADPAAMIARIESPQTPNRQGLDALTLAEVMRRFRVPGVERRRHQGLPDPLGQGLRCRRRRAPAAPVETDTAFQAASISKPVTAMAAMRLVQDGTLGAR